MGIWVFKPTVVGYVDSTIKTLSSSVTTSEKAMEIMGAYGTDRNWDVEKHWRDIKMGQLYEGGKQLAQMDTARFFYDCKTL